MRHKVYALFDVIENFLMRHRIIKIMIISVYTLYIYSVYAFLGALTGLIICNGIESENFLKEFLVYYKIYFFGFFLICIDLFKEYIVWNREK